MDRKPGVDRHHDRPEETAKAVSITNDGDRIHRLDLPRIWSSVQSVSKQPDNFTSDWIVHRDVHFMCDMIPDAKWNPARCRIQIERGHATYDGPVKHWSIPMTAIEPADLVCHRLGHRSESSNSSSSGCIMRNDMPRRVGRRTPRKTRVRFAIDWCGKSQRSAIGPPHGRGSKPQS